jgi:hypothetical protein
MEKLKRNKKVMDGTKKNYYNCMAENETENYKTDKFAPMPIMGL